MKLKEILRRIDKALAICDNPDMDWETKYDGIFGMEILRKIRKSRYSLHDYYDPDASYEKDVLAYCEALKEFKRRHDVKESPSVQ